MGPAQKTLALMAALLVVSACAEPRSIGTLIHEGPTPLPRSQCLVAVNPSSRLVWVSGRRVVVGPAVGHPRDIAFDRVAERLLVLGAHHLSELELTGDPFRSRRPLEGAERVWPVGGGLLVVFAGGRFTHLTDDGAATARLPPPRSLWERGEHLYWVGPSHPRVEEGPVLLRAARAAPLSTAELVPVVPPARSALAAPGASASTPVWIHQGEDGLQISHGDEAWNFGDISAVPVAAVRIEPGLYAVALERERPSHELHPGDPPGGTLGNSAVLVFDLEAREGHLLEGLRPPLAHSPCPPVEERVEGLVASGDGDGGGAGGSAAASQEERAATRTGER